MAVYVNEPIWQLRGRRWCHLPADSEAELDAFAARLGLKRAWFQSRPGRPLARPLRHHREERRRALALGAIALSIEQAGEQTRLRRAKAR